MSLETDINRCVFDMKELVQISLTNELLEARSMGRVELTDEQLKAVVNMATNSVSTTADRTVTRISSILTRDK